MCDFHRRTYTHKAFTLTQQKIERALEPLLYEKRRRKNIKIFIRKDATPARTSFLCWHIHKNSFWMHIPPK